MTGFPVNDETFCEIYYYLFGTIPPVLMKNAVYHPASLQSLTKRFIQDHCIKFELALPKIIVDYLKDPQTERGFSLPDNQKHLLKYFPNC